VELTLPDESLQNSLTLFGPLDGTDMLRFQFPVEFVIVWLEAPFRLAPHHDTALLRVALTQTHLLEYVEFDGL
jgi:hypothetical protein